MKTLKLKLKKLTKQQFKTLKDFSYYSNNLYNYSLCIIREYYKETTKYIGFNKLYHEAKKNENFKLLPSRVATCIVQAVDQNYKSFFATLKKDPKVKPPRFLKKGEQNYIPYGYKSSILFNNILTFYISKEYKKFNPKTKTIEIPFTYTIDGTIKQIIIKPVKGFKYFNMYIQYEENNRPKPILDQSKYLSIDLGLDNLATCFTNSGRSFIMNGKPLKSFNRWYNKEKAKYTSNLKLINKKNWSKRLTWLEERRKWFIDNYFNQTVSYITKYCLENNIGNVVCGYNESWKQDINLGKVNNQKFAMIPFFLFKKKLETKCKSLGINFILQEESYTSKTSFLDKDSFESKTFSGKRIKRGLYKSKEDILINADVNGSANILRKVIGNVVYNNLIVALMLRPLKVNLL